MEEATPSSLGRYTIRAELGRGGFATVYRALDPSLEREVALKVLHPQLTTDRTFAQRFRREARALAGMRHPNIITVYEVGEADGRLYIAMELANGPSLAQTLADRGRLAWKETLAILKPVCDALDYAHAQGIVHRDLKPANILLDQERGPLLTDFGFAKLIGENSLSMSLSGGILGTPAYIAPEVWELEAAKPAADIYALGSIVYEMLTGQVLFTGKTPMQIMRAHDQGPQWSPAPAWSVGVPTGIEAVLRQALARQPEARYPSASALWQALNDLEADAQASREKIERAATAAQWRTETEAALAAGKWSVAKMAVSRWLAITPEDPATQAARTEIEHQEAEVRVKQEAGARARQEAEARTKQEAERRAAEETARKAREERERQARATHEAAQKKTVAPGTPPPMPSRVTPQPALTKWRVPIWAWIGGGLALLVCVIIGIVVVQGINPKQMDLVPAPTSVSPAVAPTTAPSGDTSVIPSGDAAHVSALAVVGDYVWAGTDGGLIRWSADGSARVFRLTDLGGFPDNEANVLAASDETLWIGSGGVAHIRPMGDQVQALGYYNKDDGLGTGAIRALMVDRDGSIWAGGPEQVKPPLAHFEGQPGSNGNAWRTDQVPMAAAIPGQKLNIRSLLRSRDGGLWVGLDEGAILEWDGKTWRGYGAAEGLSVGDPVNDRIRTLLQDRNGTIWAAATHQGLLRLDAAQGRWQRVSVQADAPIRGIAEFADGSLWASGDQLVARSADGGKTWTQVGTGEGLGTGIGSVVQDGAGRVWAGAYDGGISVLDGQAWHSLQR